MRNWAWKREDFRYSVDIINYFCKFVGNIYKKASYQYLSRSHAEAEAIALIENGYPNTCNDGYSAAYLDAKDDVVTVLLHIAVIIKTEMRLKYVRWVSTHHIDPLNWQLKRDLVDALKNRFPFLPQSMKRLSSSQLANHIDELILAVIYTKHGVHGWLHTGDVQFA